MHNRVSSSVDRLRYGVSLVDIHRRLSNGIRTATSWHAPSWHNWILSTKIKDYKLLKPKVNIMVDGHARYDDLLVNLDLDHHHHCRRATKRAPPNSTYHSMCGVRVTSVCYHFLTFIVPPTVSISGEDLIRPLQASIVLLCQAAGNPTPTISWSKGGEPLLSSPDAARISGDGGR